ncbi:MAG: hypothetical protein KBA95_01800 [Acidobacteria bacterium]|nr:hypothetical protein [Acidobacteriota bacterium]
MRCLVCGGPTPARGCSCETDRLSPQRRKALQELAVYRRFPDLDAWMAAQDRSRRLAPPVADPTRAIRGHFRNLNAIGGRAAG